MFDMLNGETAEQRLDQARERYLTTTELIRDAQIALRPDVWDYVAGATESETSLRRNRQGIDELALSPRVMRDVSETDVGAAWFGRAA